MELVCKGGLAVEAVGAVDKATVEFLDTPVDNPPEDVGVIFEGVCVLDVDEELIVVIVDCECSWGINVDEKTLEFPCDDPVAGIGSLKLLEDTDDSKVAESIGDVVAKINTK